MKERIAVEISQDDRRRLMRLARATGEAPSAAAERLLSDALTQTLERHERLAAVRRSLESSRGGR